MHASEYERDRERDKVIDRDRERGLTATPFNMLLFPIVNSGFFSMLSSSNDSFLAESRTKRVRTTVQLTNSNQ